jgi:hypothetical protein
MTNLGDGDYSFQMTIASISSINWFKAFPEKKYGTSPF